MKWLLRIVLLLVGFTTYGQVSDTAHNPPHWIIWQEHTSPIPFNFVTDIDIAADGKKWISFCQPFGNNTGNNRGAGIARFDSADWKSWKLGPGASCITSLAHSNGDTAYYSARANSFNVPIIRTLENNQVEAVSGCVTPAWYPNMRFKDGKLELLSDSLTVLTPPDNCLKYNTTPAFKWSVYWDVPGWYLMGTYGRGIIKFNGVESITLPIHIDSVDLTDCFINAILIEPDEAATTGLGGKLWFSFYWTTRMERFSGIGIWDGQKVQIVRKETMGILSNLVYQLKRNPIDGSIWVGSLHGLARYRNGQWTAFNFGTGFMVGNEISAIEIDQLGNVWLGTNNGLVAYNDQGVVFSKRPVPKPAQPLKVFPNPAQEQTTLELWTEGPTQTTISISNLSGKLLRQEVWNIEEGGLSQYPLALTGLAQGMYVVAIESSEGRYHGRLVRY